ncbi:hypothetical protein [Luteimonas sp. MC1828]|uniref:hypothetical protein n=1 Tax=Luteimonas sp. MC1828 TaxID=2799787 RepID=UPI0018F2591E|nr:hypothetical protein [Luteimonas sp. MC1828]MBJ7575497.1 hypothetical protein [Luteimonas sp. MC1828]
MKISEMLGLLAFFWAPALILAAFLQWLILRPVAGRTLATVLLTALLVEVLLALAIWLSPLHRLLLDMKNLGDFTFGSIPLQASAVAAAVTSALVWFARRHLRRVGVAA